MRYLSQNKIENSTVLMRVDFNVPINDGIIIDDTRIINVIPTIDSLIKNKNKVILISHLGRPQKKSANLSLNLVYHALSKMLNCTVKFCENIVGKKANKLRCDLNNGEVLLLENIRFLSDEKIGKTKQATEKNHFLAKELISNVDYYVNEAFACSHRESTSMTIIPKYFYKKKFAGFLLQKEINHLSKIKNSPVNPFTAIIGGSKISTKIKLIEKLIVLCDNIIIGGAMAHTFIVYSGGKVGSSLFEPDQVSKVKIILDQAKKYNCKIHLPLDCISTNQISNNSLTKTRDIKDIPLDEMSADIGPKSIKQFDKIIKNSNKILWNGPLGVFEYSPFENGTKIIAQSINIATKLGAYSVIGGGDSIAAINKFNQNFNFSYLSTGGGAMLEFFEKEQLPALKSLED